MDHMRLRFHFTTQIKSTCFCLIIYLPIAAMEEGKKIHKDVLRTGLETDVFVGAALIDKKELHVYCWRHGFESNDKVKTSFVDMYAKNGSINVAGSLFEMLEAKRIVSWKNAMITGYAMHGHANEALDSFEELNGKALPDLIITFVGVLVACSRRAA
ncbi:Pentatricopeptide repeat-containing protein, partial [Cucurbita argyrosperma subsp. sororia]